MKKLLGFVGLILIALLTACTADNIDDIVRAGGDAVPQYVESGDGVPVVLSVGSVAGSTELTRSPLAQAGTNFSTPTGALASDYKYMGLFALAQTNLPAGGQAGPVATANILWDGSVKYARWLWNHPTKATITNQWNGNTVADYTALELMDPSTLNTTPKTAPYSYPNNNWYNYYFYAYYPRVADEHVSVSENVVTASYELDGSQDIVTGNAKPAVADEDKGFCGNYFSDIKRKEGYLPFNKQPQLTLKHHLAQLRFFICSENDPEGTFQVKGITLLDMPKEWALTIADKSNPGNTGTLTSLSATTTSIPIRTMAVDGSNNMTAASDIPVFDGNSYKNLTTTPTIAGYAMVPTTAMINDANTHLNRGFNTTYTVELVIKSGDDEIPLERTITTPIGGFVYGKVYNIIIKINQASIVAPAP